MEKDQSSNRLSNWLYIRPLEELKIFPDRSFVTRAGGAHEIREVRAGGARETDKTERNFLSEAEEIADEGGEVVVDETVAELIAGEGEAVRDKGAGGARETDETRRRGRSVSLGPVFNHLPQLVDRP